MPDTRTIDFRAVCSALHRAIVARQLLDLAAGRLELYAHATDGEREAPLALAVEGLTRLQWQRPAGAPGERMELSVVGLERLAAGDVWRLYLHPNRSETLELSCRRIACNGAEVTGVGRQYQDEGPRRALDPFFFEV